MLYTQIPKDYKVEMKVAACMIECNGEILLVQRCEDARHGGTWSEPGGKLEPRESSLSAMKREILEEIGLKLEDKDIKFLFKKYFYFIDTNISIDFYSYSFSFKPEITLSPSEHCDYAWVTPDEALKMNLVEDLDTILREIYL